MNQTQASLCYPCPPRYYCTQPDLPEPCPVGKYCEGSTGINMSLCPAGTYNPVEMLSDVLECKPCDGGSYCDVPGRNDVAGKCDEGYYCEEGVNTKTPSGTNTGTGGKMTFVLTVEKSIMFSLLLFIFH